MPLDGDVGDYEHRKGIAKFTSLAFEVICPNCNKQWKGKTNEHARPICENCGHNLDSDTSCGGDSK